MIAFLVAALAFCTSAHAARAKDIGDFYGVRDNQLTGAGLVVGLRRTGDSARNRAAIQTLAKRLEGVDMSLRADEISARNVALVMVSATLGPDARSGSRIPVTVASTGDASSLEGGVLLTTPLVGANGKVYAVAEGSLVVGGYTASAAGNASRKNTPTVGRVAAGALVEREVPTSLDYATLESIDYVLQDPDFTTAARLSEAINTEFGGDVASPSSASTVKLTLPPDMVGSFPVFAARIEGVEVEVDGRARVVINERTGTVVMGADVKISAVAVAHGGLTIEVRRVNAVSQPTALSLGQTAPYSNTEVTANENTGKLVMVEGVDIGQLVTALNDMGVKPRDLIVILESIRAAGSLHAEIVTL